MYVIFHTISDMGEVIAASSKNKELRSIIEESANTLSNDSKYLNHTRNKFTV